MSNFYIRNPFIKKITTVGYCTSITHASFIFDPVEQPITREQRIQILYHYKQKYEVRCQHIRDAYPERTCINSHCLTCSYRFYHTDPYDDIAAYCTPECLWYVNKQLSKIPTKELSVVLMELIL